MDENQVIESLQIELKEKSLLLLEREKKIEEVLQQKNMAELTKKDVLQELQEVKFNY